MADSDSINNSDKLTDSPGLEVTGKIMVAVLMILFFSVVLVLFLHLYFKCFTYRSNLYDIEAPSIRRRRRRSRRFEIISVHTATSHRLDPSVLNSIPVITYSSKDKEMECAVCLSETVEGDKIRILPKCNHGFHVDCIDMWFQSNSTCPICRNEVSINGPELKTKAQSSVVFPTNVLVWGNQGEVTVSEEPSSSATSSSSSSDRPHEMVIEIPRQVDGDHDETRSPIMKRLKSLQRLLSMGAARVNPSTSTADPGKKDPEHC